jgi:hypothetical protein
MNIDGLIEKCQKFDESIKTAYECLDSITFDVQKSKSELDWILDTIRDRRISLDQKTEKLESAVTRMDSKILPYSLFMCLNSACGFSVEQRWKLLYRASVDGFQAADFHRKCDNQKNTLTIIMSLQNKNVFGGYANVAWDSTSGYKPDDGSFIFSFKDKTFLKLNCINKTNSITCKKHYGATFGAFDIFISDQSNCNDSSFSNLGQSYALPPGFTVNTDPAKSFLAGSLKFKVEEIEVFTKN